MYNYVTKYHFYNKRNGQKVDDALDIMLFDSYVMAMSQLITKVEYKTTKAKSGYVHIQSSNMLSKATIAKLDKLITTFLERTGEINQYHNAYLDPIEGLHFIKTAEVATWIDKETNVQHPKCKWIVPYVDQIKAFQKAHPNQNYYFSRIRPQGDQKVMKQSVINFKKQMANQLNTQSAILSIDDLHMLVINATKNDTPTIDYDQLHEYMHYGWINDTDNYQFASLAADYWRNLNSVMPA